MYQGRIVSFQAVADLTAKRGYLVAQGAADNSIALASSATTRILGVLTPAVADGSSVATGVGVQIYGIADVVYGGSVTRGATLTTDANGKAVTTTTAGNRVLGVALESGADGELHRVLLTPGSLVPA